MTTNLQIASAKIPQKGKGEDYLLVRRLNDTGSLQLLAVADGLSLNAGKAAAKWVIERLRRINDVASPRSIFKAINRELQQTRPSRESQTTLTCGILREVQEEDIFLRFDYFAIGDSPIWKVVVGDSRFPFQRVQVHGSPYPAETARVYSALRLHERDIKGAVTFGAIEIAVGEVLVVCTDGIPEREVFFRDFSNNQDSCASRLCQWFFERESYSDDKLKRILKSYDDRGVLFDDATIIAARLKPPPLEPESHAGEKSENPAEAEQKIVGSANPASEASGSTPDRSKLCSLSPDQ